METKNSKLSVIHSDYQPIGDDIPIHERKRNRRRDVANDKDLILDTNFQNKILSRCENDNVKGELLRRDQLLQVKSDSMIRSDLDLQDISPDQMVEGVSQYKEHADEYVTILGYCEGMTVYAKKRGDKKLMILCVFAETWYPRHCILSRV